MPPNIKKIPGVYIEEVAGAFPSVVAVESAVPVFIGYTEKALDVTAQSLTNVLTRITSLLDYERYYGKAVNEQGIKVSGGKISSNGSIVTKASITPSPHNMYYSLRLYFANGGGPCFILSIGASGNGTTVKKAAFVAALKVLAAKVGPTIVVIPETAALSEKDYYEVIDQFINQCAQLQDRFMLVDIHTQPASATTANILSSFRTKFMSNNYAQYAAAYFPNLITVFPYQYADSQVDVVVTIDAQPASKPVKLKSLLVSDPPMYKAAKSAVDALQVVLPPSPAVAGILFFVDSTRGVWKAPANVSVAAVASVAKAITNSDQDVMNVDIQAGRSVNAIRNFVGQGILVWGARTLDGNSQDWRYIPVRRFCIMVEQSIKRAVVPFAFETNDVKTWVKIKGMLENFLTELWRQKALQGVKPENAFFVHIGLGQTMTAKDIQDGNLVIQVGLAITRPAEFIVITFRQKMQGS